MKIGGGSLDKASITFFKQFFASVSSVCVPCCIVISCNDLLTPRL